MLGGPAENGAPYNLMEMNGYGDATLHPGSASEGSQDTLEGCASVAALEEEDTHLGAAAGRSNSHLLHDGSECSRQDQQPCSSTLAPATPAASGRPDAGDSLWEPGTDMIWGAPASTLRSPSPQRQPDSYSATRRGWQAGRQVCSSTSQGVAAGRGLPAGPQADVFAEVRLGWEARSRSGSAEAEFGQGSSAALLPEPTSQMDPWSPLPCGISAKRSPVLQLLDGAPADWIGDSIRPCRHHSQPDCSDSARQQGGRINVSHFSSSYPSSEQNAQTTPGGRSCKQSVVLRLLKGLAVCAVTGAALGGAAGAAFWAAQQQQKSQQAAGGSGRKQTHIRQSDQSLREPEVVKQLVHRTIKQGQR